jgi:hypothetical protein
MMHVGKGVHRDSFPSETLLACCMFYVVFLHLVSGHWTDANKWVLKVGAYLNEERYMTSMSKIRQVFDIRYKSLCD